MKNQITRWATDHPRLVYLAVLMITLLLGAQIPRIQVDTDPENMLRSDDPARAFHNQVKQDFALHDALVVGIVNDHHPDGIFNPVSLAAINRLSSQIVELEGVVRQDLMALGTVDNISQQEPGTIRFEWLMRQAPQSRDQALAVREAVKRLPLLDNTLVSADGKAAAIYIPLESKAISYQRAESIRAMFKELNTDDQYYLTGLPVAEDQFGVEMFIQMGISAPLAGAMIFFLLWVFFRNLPLIVAPMLVAMSTVICTMGLLIAFGFPVHIMSSMIAIFLMPIAVVDSVHLLSEFADRYKPGSDRKAVIRDVIQHLFTPMLYTSITSTVGFLSLMLTPIPPVQVFGAFIGFGILLAFALTITLVPAYIVRMSEENLEKLQARMHQGRTPYIDHLLSVLGRLATRRGRTVITLVLALFALSLAGLSRIEVNDNPIRWFKSDHEIRVADRVLNDHFAGTYDAYLVLTSSEQGPSLQALRDQLTDNQAKAAAAGITLPALPVWEVSGPESASQRLSRISLALDDLLFDADSRQTPFLEASLQAVESTMQTMKRFQSPDVLAYIERLQAKLGDSGLVGKSNALPDLVKTVSRELQSGQDRDYRLPTTPEAVAQTLLQYQSSHRPNDLWHFVTPDYRSSLIWLQLTSGDNQDMSRVVALVDAFVTSHPLPEGIQLQWAGKAYLNLVWQDAMVNGMLNSLLSAFAIVFLIMTLLFRSPLFGLLAMLPLTFTISFIYGLIGWVGKDYDMPIAVLSALTLGLSVDFAIHFLERARALHRQTGSLHRTLVMMFEEPGRAITRNALVIALGFTPLLLAPLVPYITVGTFLASIMAFSALITLLLLPALLVALSRWAFKPPVAGSSGTCGSTKPHNDLPMEAIHES